MRSFVLLLLSLALPVLAAPTWWSGAVGPEASLGLAMEGGVFSLRLEERWGEEPRVSIARGRYSFSGELLELDVDSVSFEGEDSASRRPEEGFFVETPRLSVMDHPVPKIHLRPRAYLRLNAIEDGNMLELRGNGGFALTLTR